MFAILLTIVADLGLRVGRLKPAVYQIKYSATFKQLTLRRRLIECVESQSTGLQRPGH